MTLLKTCVAPGLLWSFRLTPTVFPLIVVAAESLCTCRLPLTLFPYIVTAAELLETCRLPLMMLPAHEGVPEPMRIAVPLLWNTRLLEIVVPQTSFVAVLFGRLWIVRPPLMVVDGPMGMGPPFTVTLLPMVAPLRTRLPPVSVMLPDVPPPTKTQFCP